MPRTFIATLCVSFFSKLASLRGAFLIAGFFCLAPGFSFAESVRCQLADGFDFPVGKPNAEGYYKARGFWPNGHLGEDWNGRGGGDSDLGDPIYAMGHGVVVVSQDVKVGWGNCVIVRHAYREASGKIEMVDSLYAHLLERKVQVGQLVQRGQLVGLMGGNNGMYPVHLHFEIRKNLNIGMNRMKFARDYSNYHNPTPFIEARRQLAADFKKYEIVIDNFAPYGGDQDEQKSLAVPSTFGTGAPGVTKTARGLSIPVINTPGTTSAPPSSPSGVGTSVPSASPSGIPGASPDGQGDFWSRLKSKLGSGQVTPGTGEKE